MEQLACVMDEVRNHGSFERQQRHWKGIDPDVDGTEGFSRCQGQQAIMASLYFIFFQYPSDHLALVVMLNIIVHFHTRPF